MRNADDITALFKVFGGNPEHYVEGDRTLDATGRGERWPLLQMIEAEASGAPDMVATAANRRMQARAEVNEAWTKPAMGEPSAELPQAKVSAEDVPAATTNDVDSGTGANAALARNAAVLETEAGIVPPAAVGHDAAGREQAKPHVAESVAGATQRQVAATSEARLEGRSQPGVGNADCVLSSLFERLSQEPDQAPVDPLKKLRFS